MPPIVLVALGLIVSTMPCSAATGPGDFVVTDSYKVARGQSYEQQIASFNEYLANNASSMRNTSWNVGYGTSVFRFDLLRSPQEGWMNWQSTLTYQVPPTLTPGQSATITYMLTGDIGNARPHWNVADTWIGNLAISMYAGNDRDRLSFYGQMRPEAYHYLDKKSASGKFTFTVPSGARFFVLHVTHGTPIIGGVGMGYAYEVDGKAGSSAPAKSQPPSGPPAAKVEYDPEGRPMGEVGWVSGSVDWAENDQAALAGQWNFLRPGMVIKGGMVIRTGEDSSCMLDDYQEGQKVINAESFVRIRPRIKRLEGFQKWLDLKYGSIKINVKNMIEGKNTPIIDLTETPDYQAFVKGTVYVCEYANSVSVLKVLEGAVECVSKATGKTMTVQSGQQLRVNAGGFSPVERFDVQAEAKRWVSLEKDSAKSRSTSRGFPSSSPRGPATVSAENRLGTEWSVAEAGIPGRWVRRGDSDTWDGSWANGAVAILSISIAGDKVRIGRKDVSGPSTGLTAIYEGILAPDGTVQGTQTVTAPSRSTQKWQGRIVKGLEPAREPIERR